MMRILKAFIYTLLVVLTACGCKTIPGDVQSISAKRLKDKIAGGWAGKMIGVTYGAPTEFRAQGKTFDDSIHWTPKDIRGSMWQDDIYVQLTFMMTMDKYGIDAPAEKFQEMFAKAGYMLWHANVQARKNYYDSIFPPASGNPEFNSHADDIDFQIEADYLGLMCPGMPVTASKMADKIGHIMNYGDGVYGGIFVSALYTQAFFECDIQKIIENALKSVPAESDYAKIVSDVIILHKQYPDDWKAAWKELMEKWDKDHFCASGETFNIDAKVNGAFIVLGLLYGDGDPMKTLDITTRCGQDSDCNPSSAMAVLGVIIGFDKLPPDMKKGVVHMGDSLFINTDYSFNKAVENTFRYATKLIVENGGKAGENEITVLMQLPVAPALEVSFPDVILDKKISIFDKGPWTFTRNWKTYYRIGWPAETSTAQAKYAENAGDAMEINFSGTGISIDGNWFRDGGKADVFLDGKFVRTIDTYYFYNNQEHDNITIWHKTGLPDTQHSVKLVVTGNKKPESMGTRVYITKATIYKTAPKKSSSFKFSFEK
jgi:hypothetical protein